jgi:AcrR family transcriptional regulator
VGRPPESATDSDIPRDVRDVGHHEQTSQRWDLAKEVNTPATIAIQPISRLKPRSMSRPKQVKDTLTSTNPAVLKVQLIETGSPDRVTIATIVKEAGCTPPSLYHYWSTRDLLLKEASASGWAQFRVSQTDAVADDLSPVERLRLRGRAYLEFALAEPALFRVLFLEPPAAGPGEPPPETGSALGDLVADVTAAMASGKLRIADPLTTALVLWSAMHGVAALWAVNPNLPTVLAHSVGDLAQNAVLIGLAP